VGLTVKYSSEQRFVSFSENVSDRGNAISAVSAAFAASLVLEPCTYSKNLSKFIHNFLSGPASSKINQQTNGVKTTGGDNKHKIDTRPNRQNISYTCPISTL